MSRAMSCIGKQDDIITLFSDMKMSQRACTIFYFFCKLLDSTLFIHHCTNATAKEADLFHVAAS